MIEWLHGVIWQGREYAGIGMLIAGGLTTFAVLWMFRLKNGIDKTAALVLAPLAFVLICRGGTKPPPPDPPPLPPLSEYARIYARPEWGGSSTNKILNITPKGKVRVINE